MLIFFSYSSAPLTAPVQITIWILPEELTLEWDKQLLGNQIITDVSSLLESSNTWEGMFPLYVSNMIGKNGTGDISGFSASSAKISIVSKKVDVLVSSILYVNLFMIECTL